MRWCDFSLTSVWHLLLLKVSRCLKFNLCSKWRGCKVKYVYPYLSLFPNYVFFLYTVVVQWCHQYTQGTFMHKSARWIFGSKHKGNLYTQVSVLLDAILVKNTQVPFYLPRKQRWHETKMMNRWHMAFTSSFFKCFATLCSYVRLSR